MRQQVITMLEGRGVTLVDIAELVFELQKGYCPTLRKEECLEAVEQVLNKREVQYVMMVGICLDQLVEEGSLPEPLQTIITDDESLFNVDEVVAMGITYMYGTVAMTTFGYLDKSKPGIIKDINGNIVNRVNTFLDDLVAALASAASARIAHG